MQNLLAEIILNYRGGNDYHASIRMKINLSELTKLDSG